ncbi:hypothetical protein BB560_004472 [Smittium megazygosporum]|uniref:E2 ubiquitin-conjugating enzyme n=1 Tax=Smittium megazygosporum TaxID=133381 RepID=A0A2T9Z951_9FUNG|nr:hypothetical protein BB560_004472 [Smittium megazygosporum]
MQLSKHPVEGFSAGLVDDSNLYEWEIIVIGPPDTLYEGGFFKARMTFPEEYPVLPPKLRFLTELWHPNVYEDGNVCISILHPPGDDQFAYEHSGERWSPVQSVESIMLSVISMLSDPNDESPANIEAAKLWRESYPEYKKRVQRTWSMNNINNDTSVRYPEATASFLHKEAVDTNRERARVKEHCQGNEHIASPIMKCNFREVG